MKFVVKCVTPTSPDVQEDWTFDNYTNKIVAPNGMIQYYWNDPRFFELNDIFRKQPASRFSASEPMIGKVKLLSKLKIQLGLACNWKCKYCLQTKDREKPEQQPNEGELQEFIEKLTQSGIQIKEEGCVEFWGGEPLVYIKTLYKLIPMLRAMFGFDIQFKLHTNGSLLTDAIVDFFIENRVRILISHDGPGQCLRNENDPLDNAQLKAVWMRLKDKAESIHLPMEFHTVITPKTVDFDEIFRFFAENFSPDVGVSFEGMVKTDKLNKECSEFTQSDQQTLAASIFNGIVNMRIHGLDHWADDLLGRLVHRVPISCMGGRCDAGDPSVLVVDLKGRVNLCQNKPITRYKIGTIEDISKTRNPYLTHWSYREKCNNCLVVSSCKGGCPANTNEEYQVACTNEFIYHSSIFTAIWYLLTERLIVGVQPSVGENNA